MTSKVLRGLGFWVILPTGLLIGWLWLSQGRLIFPAPDTRDIELSEPGFSNVQIETEDGETLSSFWRQPDAGLPAIIVFHGNGDAAVLQGTKARALATAGFGVLLAEYRGYGGSTGTPSETGLHIDALAAYEFVRKNTSSPIGLYAHSLGTGVAVKLAATREVFAVILESPFDSLLAVAQETITWLPMNLLLKHQFRSDKIIGGIKAPLLIMHGKNDGVITIEHGKNLMRSAPVGTRFVAIDDAGHNNLLNFGTIDRAIGFFLENETR